MTQDQVIELQRLKEEWEAKKGDEGESWGYNEAEAYIAALEQRLWECINEPTSDEWMRGLLNRLSGKQQKDDA